MSAKALAFDIETDTSVNGLDPQVAAITEIAYFDGDHGGVLSGDEQQILADFSSLVAAWPANWLVTWNGAVFDLPFIDARSRQHFPGGMRGLTLNYDPHIPVKYEPTPGYQGGYDATLHSLPHLDISVPFRNICNEIGAPHSLKPAAKALGFQPVELDRANIHSYSSAEREEYALSDARITWQLWSYWSSRTNDVDDLPRAAES